MRLDLGPDVREGRLQDLANGRILSAVRALTSNLQRLRDGSVMRGASHHRLRGRDSVRHGAVV